MKKVYLGFVLFLVGCTTPLTVMQNGNSTVTCGGGTAGSAIGGVIGYNIQKHHDQDCVDEYSANGYKVVSQSK